MKATELAKKIHEVHGDIHNRTIEGTDLETVSVNWLSAHPMTRRITTEFAEWILANFTPKSSPSNK
jgi:hypothetical protein